MASPQQIRLRWTSHQGTILSLFDALLSNESLVDVTLAAEGKYLKAHKVILASCSPFFQELLSLHHGEKHAIVFLKDVKYSHLQALINYMYRGEVNILQTELQPLLDVAESLQIRGLSERSFNNDPSVLATTHFLGGGSISTGGGCTNQSKETIILPPIDTAPCSGSVTVNNMNSNSVNNVSTTQISTPTPSMNTVVNDQPKSAAQPPQGSSSSQKIVRNVTNATSRSEEKTSTPCSSTSKSSIIPVRLSNYSSPPLAVSHDERTKSTGPNVGVQQHSPAKRTRIDQSPTFRQPNATSTSSVVSTPTTSTSITSSVFLSPVNSNSVQNESSKPRQTPVITPVPVEIPSFEIIPKAESPVVVNIDDDDDEDGQDNTILINENSQNETWAFEDTGIVESEGGSGGLFNPTSDSEQRTAGNDSGIHYDPGIMENNPNMGDSSSMHQCPTCLKLYQVKGSLLRHLKYECQKPPRFRCEYCGIKFRHGFRLASHKNICKLKR